MVGELFVYLVIPAAAAVTAYARRSRERRMLAAFARELGLARDNFGLHGIVEGVSVRIRTLGFQDDGAWQCSVFLGGPRALPGFDAGAMHLVGRLSRLLGREIATGDPDFDARVLLEGDEIEIAAHLTADARECLGALVRRRVTLRGGWIVMPRVPATPQVVRARIVSAGPYVRRLTGAGAKADRCACLIANALGDPLGAVRLHNLELLFRHFATDPRVPAALLHALRDSDPRVRLLAARNVPVDSGEISPYRHHAPPNGAYVTLLELAQGPHGTGLRAAAIEALAERYDPDRIAEPLLELLEDGSEVVRQSAARSLARAAIGGRRGEGGGRR